MRVFLLDKRYNGEAFYSLSEKEKRYLTKSLRLEAGVTFTSKDHSDNYYTATLIDSSTLELKETQDIEDNLLDNLSGFRGEIKPIYAYISLLKGKKLEGVIRSLTEMGIKKIVLMSTEFSEEKTVSEHQEERYHAIIKEAVEQSGAKAPTLIGPISFKKAISEENGLKLLFHQDKDSKSFSLNEIFLEEKNINSIVSLYIGPEGGFSDDECNLAHINGAKLVLLKTNILKAETAMLYAAAAVQTLIQ